MEGKGKTEGKGRGGEGKAENGTSQKIARNATYFALLGRRLGLPPRDIHTVFQKNVTTFLMIS